MNPVISAEYATLNRQLHAEDPNYGASAGEMAWHVVQVAKDNQLEVILDYGCGKGTLKPAIKKLAPRLKVLEFDPGVPGKETMPTRRPDLLVALDVMEHIEPDYLGAVLKAMHDARPKAVYLMIALQPANKTLPDGRNSHLIVEPASWWDDRLKPYFKAVHEQRTPTHFRFVGVPI